MGLGGLVEGDWILGIGGLPICTCGFNADSGLTGTGLAGTGITTTGLTGTELTGSELIGTGFTGSGINGTGLAGTGLAGSTSIVSRQQKSKLVNPSPLSSHTLICCPLN